MNQPTEEEVQNAIDRRAEILRQVGDAYQEQVDERMGQLHNQFVVFISSSKLPLSQVLLVLEIMVRETIDQAKAKYVDGA